MKCKNNSLLKVMKCKNNSLLFVCYPSLALLDNWLPVIWAIKQKNPSINLIFYSPIARTIDEIDLGNVLIKISREIFDEIIYIGHSGFLLSANSFGEAKRINNRNFIQKIARRVLGLLGFKNDKLLFILNSIISQAIENLTFSGQAWLLLRPE